MKRLYLLPVLSMPEVVFLTSIVFTVRSSRPTILSSPFAEVKPTEDQTDKYQLVVLAEIISV